jgi:hypothetical protein
VRVRVPVELPPKVRSLYRDMEREMFMAIAGHEVEAVNAAAKTIKCLQLANGAVYVDPAADSDTTRRRASSSRCTTASWRRWATSSATPAACR